MSCSFSRRCNRIRLLRLSRRWGRSRTNFGRSRRILRRGLGQRRGLRRNWRRGRGSCRKIVRSWGKSGMIWRWSWRSRWGMLRWITQGSWSRLIIVLGSIRRSWRRWRGFCIRTRPTKSKPRFSSNKKSSSSRTPSKKKQRKEKDHINAINLQKKDHSTLLKEIQNKYDQKLQDLQTRLENEREKTADLDRAVSDKETDLENAQHELRHLTEHY